MGDRYMGHQIRRDVSMDDDYEDAMKLKRMADRESEKIFIQMMINDYICKGKTWEDLKREQRPSGYMSEWSRNTAKLLGLKSTDGYKLSSPPVSPDNSPKGKLSKKQRKHKKESTKKPKRVKKSQTKPRRTKSSLKKKSSQKKRKRNTKKRRYQ